MDGNKYGDLLRPLFAGRRVLFVGEVAAGYTVLAEQAKQLGAAEVLIVATAIHGSGPLPDEDVAKVVVLTGGAVVEGPMASIRFARDAIASPSPELLRHVRAFDPDGTALAFGSFLNDVADIDGRPFLAWRRPEWVALEDKTTVDAFWDRAGVDRAPYEVVSVVRSALQESGNKLDRGHGVVWSGDAREGMNGGAEYVRWIRTTEEFEDAFGFFVERCDRVRLMPFLEGIPCSIHGVVFPEEVVALRPVEMVVLRRDQRDADHGAFSYRGCASFFDPDKEVRAQMISMALKVGARLRDEVAFRGAFTVDGVATSEGFVPTELNPRMGAGLNTILSALPDLPIQLLLDAIVGEVPLDFDPLVFGRELVDCADALRSGGTWGGAASGAVVPETIARLAQFRSGEWAWVDEHGRNDQAEATVWSGMRPSGGFARVVFHSTTTPVGPSIAPRAAAMWAFLDRELGMGLGSLTSAVDVRPPTFAASVPSATSE